MPVACVADGGRVLEAKVLARPRLRPATAKAGLPWSETEDQQLGAEIDQDLFLVELMKAHQRSRGAISAWLLRLGRALPARA